MAKLGIKVISQPKGKPVHLHGFFANFTKLFASPGIDSKPEEFGAIASGAGQRPIVPVFKTPPTDWLNYAPEQGDTTGELISGYGATKAPDARSLRIRRRGNVAPFGGTFVSVVPGSLQHPGGATDLNPGAGHLIAGGPGGDSSFVRVIKPGDSQGDKFRKRNSGMKLPILPVEETRGGTAPLPTGGNFDAALSPPVTPKVSGWPTIFAFRGGTGAANVSRT